MRDTRPFACPLDRTDRTNPARTFPDTFDVGQFPTARYTGELDRSDFDISYGQPIFDMGVTLRISVEASPAED